MASKSGFAAKVTWGTYTIAGMGSWTMDGLTRDTIEDMAFGDTVNKYQFGAMDGGSLTFEGNYDPLDSTGQAMLNSACINASMVGSNLKLYIDSVSNWQIASGGTLLVTKANAVSMEKSGLGKISFTCKVSGAQMELV